MAIRIFRLPLTAYLSLMSAGSPPDEALSESSYEKLLLPRAGFAAFGTI